MDLEALREVAQVLSSAIEIFETDVVEWSQEAPGKHTEVVHHHIHDHLGWAEQLINDEIRRLSSE